MRRLPLVNRKYALRYPRRQVVRFLFRAFIHIMTRLLMRVEITGHENFPKRGPLLLVANHIAVVEAALLIAYTPYNVEVIAAGDIPLDPRYGWLAYLYGMIPIKRGSMDREGLGMALDVLEQGGVVGLFPEGGIWEASLRDARTGVAWLSQKSGAPIVPIGFGGLTGAITAAVKFQRPRVYMNIGKTIPALGSEEVGQSRKRALTDGANMVMERVKDLIPAEQIEAMRPKFTDERFDFEVKVKAPNGEDIIIPGDVDIQLKQALGKVFYRPVMLDVFARNLRLSVKPLQLIEEYHAPQKIVDATQEVLDYLETNPYFFQYRFGAEQGEAMAEAYDQLHNLARWVAATHPDAVMKLTPIRTYTLIATQASITETVPPPVPEI
jgi:1-acyl-sn-glycerol-3-phosphate acyltransferase